MLILASTSPYRRELLARLGLPFEMLRPDVDEAALPGEPAAALAQRLALAKARAVARAHPEAVVIGSDQVCRAGSRLLGKPGTVAAACAQLAALSGGEAEFLTALSVIDGPQARTLQVTVPTTVRFRALSAAQIARYVEHELPLDCAGSFKAEGLGIALFESLRSDDPTALIGLPLIALTRCLRELGLDPLGDAGD
jgi:septum formation protein